MAAFLFVHFREKTTPDGEQVYFAISKNGFDWEQVNDGAPVLWCYYGTRGVRDCTVVRSCLNGHFYVIGTDLSISYGTRNLPGPFWDEVSRNGSTKLSIWESEDLVNWKEQRLAEMGSQFGCVWAPDVIYDKAQGDYVLHWSSNEKGKDPFHKKIWYSRTRDFIHFSEARVLFEEPVEMIDSALYEDGGRYYLFVKHAGPPCRIALFTSDAITGPYKRNPNFDQSMEAIEAGLYEAPTAVKLEDGRWLLFLDYYGTRGAMQGYVPFISENIEAGFFERSDSAFSFPYHFKHGTILKITDEEYDRIRNHDWSDKGYVPEDFE